MAVVSKVKDQENMLKAFEEAILLEFHVGALGIKRAVNPAHFEVQADKSMLGFTKDILACEEYDRIQKHYGIMKRYLSQVSIPSIVKRGCFMIPAARLTDVDKRLRGLIKEWDDLVDEFISGAYRKARASAKERLKGLYDELDYPEPEQVRKMFYVTIDYREAVVPKKLRAISVTLFKREEERFKQARLDEAEGFRALLREQFLKLLQHFQERLQGKTEDGKKKVFRDSTIKNIEEFIEFFEPKNITRDAAMSTMVKRTRELIRGTDIESLRNDETYRKVLAEQVAGINAELGKMVVGKAARRFRMAEESGE